MINQILVGDVLEKLREMPDNYVNCIITSPPYWGLRDYGVERQIGLEPTLDLYLENLLKVTQELKRVLRKDGILFWNQGDSYSGGMKSHKEGEPEDPKQKGRRFDHQVSLSSPAKCLNMQNYRLILKMIDQQGWILRNTIIWHKKNPMPSSVKDRFTNTYEPVFFLVKKKKYWSDLDAVRKRYDKPLNRWGGDRKKITDHLKKNSPHAYAHKDRDMRPNKLGKNPRDLFKIATQPFPEAHFATFPEKLIEPLIKFGCPRKGIVLDPFIGSGTVAKVALELGRNYLGIELNPEYVEIAKKRISAVQPTLL